MIIPKYRVGQLVSFPSSLLDIGNTENETTTYGRILYPIEDGTYFLNIKDSGAYAIIDEHELEAVGYKQFNPHSRSNIRIVFFGNGQFALPTLKVLVERGYNVVAVVTGEDKPRGRGQRLRPTAVKEYAKAMGLPVLQPQNLGDPNFLSRISKLRPTLGVVVEFRILPSTLYSIPKWGTINLHSSLLPMYRGASPITAAIKDGNSITGITTFLLNDKVDTGCIINNLAIGIQDSDNAEAVHIKLREAGAEMMDNAIQLRAHNCPLVPQSELYCDFIEPSYAPKLRKRDSFIPWLKPAKQVYDFIRAHSPIPAAWTTLFTLDSYSPTYVKIYGAKLTDIPKDYRAPGEWLTLGNKIYVACTDYLLEITEIQFPDRRRMSVSEFLNGYRSVSKGFCELVLQRSATFGYSTVEAGKPDTSIVVCEMTPESD